MVLIEEAFTIRGRPLGNKKTKRYICLFEATEFYWAVRKCACFKLCVLSAEARIVPSEFTMITEYIVCQCQTMHK